LRRGAIRLCGLPRFRGSHYSPLYHHSPLFTDRYPLTTDLMIICGGAMGDAKENRKDQAAIRNCVPDRKSVCYRSF